MLLQKHFAVFVWLWIMNLHARSTLDEVFFSFGSTVHHKGPR